MVDFSAFFNEAAKRVRPAGAAAAVPLPKKVKRQQLETGASAATKKAPTAAKGQGEPSAEAPPAGTAMSASARKRARKKLKMQQEKLLASAEPPSEAATEHKHKEKQAQADVEARKQKKQKKRQGGNEPAASAPQPRGGVPSTKSAKKMSVQERLESQLAGGRFRFINELLYTRPSAEAVELFAAEPELYEVYHEGFRTMSARWPQNPVITIAEWLREQPASWVVGDLGCGDAQLAEEVEQKVHSFDLVAGNERVTACDIANVPLPSGGLDVVVFSLSLMGSNYADFLKEAHRLLRPKGTLKVAEVASRFHDIDEWIEQLVGLGFRLTQRDESNTHFVLLEFTRTVPGSLEKAVPLKPCIYKRR